MTVLINPGVRTLVWLADPPRFYEVQLNEHGDYVYDADGAHVRTGNVIKGKNARKLMEELQRVRRVEIDPSDGHEREVRGRLPKNWLFDEYWEFGFTYKRDAQGRVVGQRDFDPVRSPVKLPAGQRGMPRGRRHQIMQGTSRHIRRRDMMDVAHVTWWKSTYPDIPFRLISRDYDFTWETLFIQDVPKDDAENILLSCVGEFLDITNGDALPRPNKPMLLLPGHLA